METIHLVIFLHFGVWSISSTFCAISLICFAMLIFSFPCRSAVAFFLFSVLLLFYASTNVLSLSGLSAPSLCSVWSAASTTLLFPACQFHPDDLSERWSTLQQSLWVVWTFCSIWVVESDTAFSVWVCWFFSSFFRVSISCHWLFFFQQWYEVLDCLDSNAQTTKHKN